MLFTFSDYTATQHGIISGGKGRVLAELFKLGYPVPDGFVITAEAFSEEGIKPNVWELVRRQYHQMINTSSGIGYIPNSVAVR